MKLRRVAACAAILPIAFALAGCEDPAKDKPRAAVATAAEPVKQAPATVKEAPATDKTSEILALDPASSSVGFTGSKVTGKHEGKFQAFTGSITLAGGKLEGGKISIEVVTGSVKTDAEKLDGHLKSDDFFGVGKFPKATFVSTDIKTGGDKGATHTVSGDLELHGVKKRVSFPVTVAVGPEAVTGTSEFVINRKDFGITYPGKADDLIRDDVVLRLSLKAQRKSG